MSAVSRSAFLLAVVPSLLIAGCSINVNKGKAGEDKRVRIDTPLGNIHVNTDRPSGTTGIAAYPGATTVPDHDGDKDADVKLGFGPWQLRVQVEHYRSSDDHDKVLAFYRKSLGRFGDVIECRDNKPVGTPTRTSEGLTCSDDDNGHHVSTNDKGLTLRAGSKRHQHIVVVDDGNSAAGPTDFSLIAIDLPTENWKKDSETD